MGIDILLFSIFFLLVTCNRSLPPQIGGQSPRRCVRTHEAALDLFVPGRRPSGREPTICLVVFSQQVIGVI